MPAPTGDQDRKEGNWICGFHSHRLLSDEKHLNIIFMDEFGILRTKGILEGVQRNLKPKKHYGEPLQIQRKKKRKRKIMKIKKSRNLSVPQKHEVLPLLMAFACVIPSSLNTFLDCHIVRAFHPLCLGLNIIFLRDTFLNDPHTEF